MAWNADIAADLRAALGPGVCERKMFGALCFMDEGHMVACALDAGALFRVGPAQMDRALAVPGAEPMAMGARRMGGMVVLPLDNYSNEDAREALLDMAFSYVASLPPKIPS